MTCASHATSPRRFLARAAAVLGLALLLPACGRQGNSGPRPGSAPQLSPEEAANQVSPKQQLKKRSDDLSKRNKEEFARLSPEEKEMMSYRRGDYVVTTDRSGKVYVFEVL